MTLAKTMEEIKKVQPYAEEDVDSGPRETLAGRRGRKNQSIEQLKRLKREYRLQLLESAAFIIVTGSAKDAFTTLATENFKCFSTNPNTLYEDLANRIPAALYSGQASLTDLFDVLGRHLEDKANELDINGYPQLIFRQEYRTTLKSKSDLVSLVRQAINDQVGSEIVGIQAATSLLNEAIKKEYTAKVAPIVLATDDEKLALDLESTLNRLSPRGVFLVVAGDSTNNLQETAGSISIKEPSAKEVKQILNNIKRQVLEKFKEIN